MADGYNPHAEDLRSTVEKERDGVDERLERLNQIGIEALTKAIREFPEVDPTELHDQLCDMLWSGEAIHEASVNALGIDPREIDEQLKQASKSAQLIVAQTMLTDKKKADRYVVVVGSIGCAMQDLKKASRKQPIAAE